MQSRNLKCYYCGYDLCGLDANAVCPECGLTQSGIPTRVGLGALIKTIVVPSLAVGASGVLSIAYAFKKPLWFAPFYNMEVYMLLFLLACANLVASVALFRKYCFDNSNSLIAFIQGVSFCIVVAIVIVIIVIP